MNGANYIQVRGIWFFDVGGFVEKNLSRTKSQDVNILLALERKGLLLLISPNNFDLKHSLMHNDPVFKFLTSMKEFSNSKEFGIYKSLRKFRRVLYAQRHNYSSLLKDFRQFHSYDKNQQFWGNESPQKRWSLQRNITTDILNYLGSTYSIIEISRKFANNTLSHDTRTLYDNLIAQRFNENVGLRIIGKLRHYLIHYSLPEVGVNLDFISKEGQKRSQLYLTPSDLLVWPKWNEGEKEYLNSQGKILDIEELLTEFHSAFMDTQRILYLKAIVIHSSSLSVLPHKMRALQVEAISVNHSHSLPFRPSTIKYIEILLSKSHNKL